MYPVSVRKLCCALIGNGTNSDKSVYFVMTVTERFAD